MYTINSNILSKSNLTAKQLKEAEEKISPNNGYNSGFYKELVKAEDKYGINALFILAHADIESAHGNSYFAKARNNLFGFNAIDSDPYQASTYKSQAASVDFYASFLKSHYLTKGAVYYNGTTPHGVFVKYSSSHDSEARSVVGLMNELSGHVDKSPTPTPHPSANKYTVKPGDTLWDIARTYGISLSRLEQINPQIKNPDLIHPGDVINVSGHQPAAHVYTVIKGDNLSKIAKKFGTTWQAIYAKNRNKIDDPDLIYPGQKLTI